MRLVSLLIILISALASTQNGPYSINEQGYLLLEAENLPHSNLWEFIPMEAGKNCTGTGYLKYVGPVTGSGHGQEIDTEGKLQGNPENWIMIPVEIKASGRYRINLRNHHMH